MQPSPIEFEPTPVWEALESGRVDSLPAYEARLDLFRLALAAEFDHLVCVPHLQGVERFWYQEETVKKVLRQFGGRAILADEVGLGKTIEAAMACKEYLLRGMVKSILFLAPPNIAPQWHSELETKFGIRAALSEGIKPSQAAQFWRQDLVVASLHTAKSRIHHPYVTGREWDMVVVDEAHHCRRRDTLSFKLVNDLRKRYILLLTATPVQNSLVELYNLLTLLKPGLLKTEAQFKKEYVSARNPCVPLHAGKLRELMAEVMIRNTRGMVDVKLPRRHAATITVSPDDKEKRLLSAVAEYARRHGRAEDADEGNGSLDTFTRTHLLQQAGSSIAGLRETLEKLAARFSHPELPVLKSLANEVEDRSKPAELIRLLRQASGKILVFVSHRAAQGYLAHLLETEGVPFVLFHGSLSQEDKAAVFASFRDEVPVMLATDSAGEGHNLQFATTVVNYDLPWNPMRIEQRIGRVHRIGQEKEVFVFNFCLRDSVEEYVLRVLHDKINMFELVVGEIDTILGDMDAEGDFSETVREMWLENQDREALERSFDDLADRMLAVKDSLRETQKLEENIFGEDLNA